MEDLGKISVIVPIYNAEKVIRRSLDSILSQSYKNLEVILVDDGSRDNSLRLCREIAASDERILVLSQRNGGPAAARNAALSRMTGQYVMFVDADDFLSPGACESMIRSIENHDLVIAHYYFDLAQSSVDHGLLSGSRVLPEKEFLEELMKRPGSFYFSALWNKLYRADIIRSLTLSFDPFFDWGEDFAFNMQYNQAVHSAAILDQPFYHYVKNVTSTSMKWIFSIPHSCRIKMRLYRLFRKIYLDRNLYYQNKWKIDRYIFNVTLAD